MSHNQDWTEWQEELADACKYGEEARARELVSQLAVQPRVTRTVLENMLLDPDALVRQAAVFALGELGGVASARRLGQQLHVEEARGDYDGESVVEAIVQALGNIEEVDARRALMRRLERLAASGAERGDVNPVARALWRRRHPELLPLVRRTLEQLALSSLNSLHGLLLLLERSPEELLLWARDPSVPVMHKTEVLTLLDEELPEALLPVLPAFISSAQALVETAVRQVGEASYHCNRLFMLLLLHRERALPSLPPEARVLLRDMARKLLAGVCPSCSLRSATLLQYVGLPEDAALIETHRPADPGLAEVFDEAAQALRRLKSAH